MQKIFVAAIVWRWILPFHDSHKKLDSGKEESNMAEQKRDYYEVLGVEKNADEAALKKAY